MLSPEVYRLTRSLASVWRSAPTIRRPFSALVVVPVAAILIPHVPIERSWRSYLLDRLRRSCARYHREANRHASRCRVPDTVPSDAGGTAYRIARVNTSEALGAPSCLMNPADLTRHRGRLAQASSMSS